MLDRIGVRSNHRVSRRRLAGGLAWSVPVVGAVASAPALAASAACPAVTFESRGSGSFGGGSVTMLNAGASPIPIGARINWTVQGTGNPVGGISVSTSDALTINTESIVFAFRTSTNLFVFTLTAPIPTGGSVSFAFLPSTCPTSRAWR